MSGSVSQRNGGNAPDMVDLRCFLEARIDALDGRLSERIETVKTAIRFSENVTEHRLTDLNALREDYNSMRGIYVIRSENDLRYAQLEDKIQSLQLSRAALDAKASQRAVNGIMVLAILSLIASVAATVAALVR